MNASARKTAPWILVASIFVASPGHGTVSTQKNDEYDGLSCNVANSSVMSGFGQAYTDNNLLINKGSPDAGGSASTARFNCPVVMSTQYSDYKVSYASFTVSAKVVGGSTLSPTCAGFIWAPGGSSPTRVNAGESAPTTGIYATNAYLQCDVTVTTAGVQVQNYQWKMTYTDVSS